jgi:acyl dehydratase
MKGSTRNSQFIDNRIFDDIKIGESASIKRTLTYKDIQLFAIMSGDINPAHLDEEYATSAIFHKIIAHGMWGGSLISTVLGTQLPGPGTIYLSQSFKFMRPVGIGDTITAQVAVTHKHPKRPILTLDCLCVNQHGKKVITGVAKVLAPIEKIHRRKVKLPKIKF